jgi:hypothetical protein
MRENRAVPPAKIELLQFAASEDHRRAEIRVRAFTFRHIR